MAEQFFLTVDGSQMECLIAVPAGNGPHPGIVLIPHLPADQGLKIDPFVDGVSDRYAEAGYVCVCPHVYHRQPKERPRPEKRDHMNDDEVMTDLNAVRDHLAALDDVDADRIAVLGHCTGGRMTILAVSQDSSYKAGIDFWGGGVNANWGNDIPTPLSRVESIQCPVAGFFGNEDERPSPADVDELETALKQHGKDYEFHRYDDAGHAFQNFANDKAYRPEASEDAWAKAIEFLDRHLKA